MAYQVPINQPLSTTQADLIAKIGSMKNILSLDFVKKFFIPADEQISAYDYIMKVLRSMGIDPIILLNSFISSFLDTSNLVELLLKASAQLATANGVKLDKNIDFELSDPPTKDEKEKLNDINFNYLNQSPLKFALTTVVDAYKMQLIKDLMTLIFGAPKSNQGNSIMGELQVPGSGRMDELMSESICGGEVFSVSNTAKERDEDLEYNRIKLRKELEKGSANVQVSCSGVEVTFPENPIYLFSDAPPGTISSSPTTPSQALTNCMDHVANQVQNSSNSNSNSQSNAKSSEKSFSESLVEKLVVHGTTLLKPLFFGTMASAVPGNVVNSFDGILTIMQAQLLSEGLAAEAQIMDPASLAPPSSCVMTGPDWDSSMSNWTPVQKKSATLIDILCNMILNAVIIFLLSFLIKKLKEFVAAYLAKRAVEKAKRKAERLKQKYQGATGALSLEKIAKQAQKAKKAVELLKVLQPVLSGSVSFT